MSTNRAVSDGAIDRSPVNTTTESLTVPATPEGVASALREIADAIEDHGLVLIGLWSTGFGEPLDAVIQVTFDSGAYPQATTKEES